MPIGAVRRQVQGWVAGENGFLDGYRDWSGFDPLAQLPWVMSLADALELWLGQDADGRSTGGVGAVERQKGKAW